MKIRQIGVVPCDRPQFFYRIAVHAKGARLSLSRPDKFNPAASFETSLQFSRTELERLMPVLFDAIDALKKREARAADDVEWRAAQPCDDDSDDDDDSPILALRRPQ